MIDELSWYFESNLVPQQAHPRFDHIPCKECMNSPQVRQICLLMECYLNGFLAELERGNYTQERSSFREAFGLKWEPIFRMTSQWTIGPKKATF